MPDIPDVIKPPADMPIVQIAMLQATIRDAWRSYLEYDGDPGSTETFWDFLSTGDHIGNRFGPR